LQSELLEKIANGELEIMQYLYSEYFQSIRHFVITNSGNEADAKDIFQEVMVVFYRKLKESDFRLTSSLKTFLYSIARLIWLKELDNRKKRPEAIDTIDAMESETHGIVQTIEHNERFRLYQEKFEELSEDCKRVLRMFLNNIPIKEITKVMGYSSDQHTKNRRFRCKKSLIQNIRNSKKFNELGNGKSEKNRGIPRW
jgi:RNA polymerase sigma factor (sigma-70 family)